MTYMYVDDVMNVLVRVFCKLVMFEMITFSIYFSVWTYYMSRRKAFFEIRFIGRKELKWMNINSYDVIAIFWRHSFWLWQFLMPHGQWPDG